MNLCNLEYVCKNFTLKDLCKTHSSSSAQQLSDNVIHLNLPPGCEDCTIQGPEVGQKLFIFHVPSSVAPLYRWSLTTALFR